jgi:hypothetical protein
MESRTQFFKLQELRTKTDRQLVIIIDKALDLAFRFASLAESKYQGISAELPRNRAQISFAEAAKLMTRVENLDERRRLEAKLQQLREDLDRLATPLRARTAYS